MNPEEIVRNSELTSEEATLVWDMFEGWRKRFALEDSRSETIAVEVPFTLRMGDYLLAGVVDRIASDRDGLFLCEWKTTRGPSRSWNEERWIESLGFGSQLSIYALAASRAEFEGLGVLGLERPRLLVRAAVKCSPPLYWPSERPLMFSFREQAIRAAENAVLAACRSLDGLIGMPAPWQIPGPWCQQYGRRCSYYAECTERIYPEGQLEQLVPQSTDPGLARIRDRIADVRVVLTASSYELVSRCRELFRRAQFPSDGVLHRSLLIGKVFHELLANYYGGKHDDRHSTQAEGKINPTR